MVKLNKKQYCTRDHFFATMSMISFFATTTTDVTVQFKFGDMPYMMAYTLDCSLSGVDSHNHNLIYVKNNQTYVSSNAFGDFATSIRTKQSATLTNTMSYDAYTNSIIIVVYFVKFAYIMNDHQRNLFVEQLNKVNDIICR